MGNESIPSNVPEDSLLSNSDIGLKITPCTSENSCLPNVRKAFPDNDDQGTQTSSCVSQQMEDTFAEEATNLTSNQPEEEITGTVSVDTCDFRPHSPQTLSERLSSAGISDDLIGILIILLFYT